MADRLYRSRDDRMIAGVAAGVAQQIDADPSIVRIVWAVLGLLTGGLAVVVYIVMAVVVPEAPPGAEAARLAGAAGAGPGAAGATSGGAAQSSVQAAPVWSADWKPPGSGEKSASSGRRGALVVGVVLILLGAVVLAERFLPSFDLGLLWPWLSLGLGIVLIVMAFIPGRRST